MERKKLLNDEFLIYRYAEKVRLLSTMDYSDVEFFEAIQDEDVNKLFEIIHRRLVQRSFIYKMKVWARNHWFYIRVFRESLS